MERLPSLSELQTIAKAMLAGKVPGLDGIPLEFFLSNWDIVGETLLRATLEGITEGKLHKRFIKGLLVLLAKRGDM